MSSAGSGPIGVPATRELGRVLRQQLRGGSGGLRLIIGESLGAATDGSYAAVKIDGIDYPLVPKLRSPDYPSGAAVYLLVGNDYMLAIGYSS